MKLLLAIYFFIIAIIQTGLFFGIYHYYRSQNIVKPSPYWMSSLLASVFALFIFGGSILSVEDIAKPQFNFTIGNTLFYVAAVLQALFCLSLNKPIPRYLKVGLYISALAFLLIFEWMRVAGTFEIRTSFMCVIASIFYIWQIVEIRKTKLKDSSTQLLYMQFASFAELFFALGRLIILIASSLTIRQIEQIPQLLILFTIAQLVMNTLSYIAIGGYWAEKFALANAKIQIENEEIKSLLEEREALIGSLLKANKTASTGALSASIAHELNQPLGASSLNIQFLQKKLAQGDLNPALQKEILDTLLADNQRAANIIRSLRSIFSESDVATTEFEVGDLIFNVLSITKPEINSKNIQVALRVESDLVLNADSGEIQQVLLNLINNAIQALVASSQENKKITITAQRSHDYVQIVIADNGDGIPTAAQDQLFELFTSTKSTGMGLGLWLCNHIVTRHGGHILFEPNEGGGAKFIVELPVA
ncbi:sensor histidine kinase [Polynucleobacter tropicus]|uniref:histidine kinase n=1 Tax=Polynucleobacter tropicus TaxID=1743174 RepID=A0A6M9PXE3_9BURK|nr:HAMP domain-containing sensor histidine kinase [Polynucleobacter tropicus]QKM64572.1 sensor histidine kinase [Polynucleobacter tropicus]